MKKNLNEVKLQDILQENRELLIVIAVFGVSLVLFVIFILPSIFSFPSKISERNIEVESLNEVKKAKAVLEAADQNRLESDLEIATKALPTERNFELILGAISEAATRSNAIVTGYKYAGTEGSAQVPQGTFPALTFKITIAGGIQEAAGFSDQLSVAYPISEVKEISYEKGLSDVTVYFYYKPFTEVNAQDVALAREKTENELKALEEISGWNLFNLEQVFIQQVATDSASPF